VARPRIPAKPSAWEVWVVVVLLGVTALINLVAMAKGESAAGAPVLAGVVVILGILSRAEWAWWLTLLASLFVGFACLYFTGNPGAMPVRIGPSVLVVQVVASFVVVGCLISARVRGTYQ
jgi:hypothetical protein